MGANTVTAVDAFCAAWSTVGQAFRSAAKIDRLGCPDATDAMVWPAAPLLSAAAVSASVASTRRNERAMTLKALADADFKNFKLSRVEVGQERLRRMGCRGLQLWDSLQAIHLGDQCVDESGKKLRARSGSSKTAPSPMQALHEDGQGALEASGLTLLQLLCSCGIRASLLQWPLHVGLLMV